ncbi:Putative Annexin ANXC4 [[Torrubiella] hemipterigena]|uniref:Putative Annexin ANXC4 n=1 Tax=[Torrubiella] hemipterigena TaxID=1531966 RepID=A0A0A1TPR5_9HYPO|nr:Putative Annexin ANXC4 [[Torrubiella] hemipterigena]
MAYSRDDRSYQRADDRGHRSSYRSDKRDDDYSDDDDEHLQYGRDDRSGRYSQRETRDNKNGRLPYPADEGFDSYMPSAGRSYDHDYDPREPPSQALVPVKKPADPYDGPGAFPDDDDRRHGDDKRTPRKQIGFTRHGRHGDDYDDRSGDERPKLDYLPQKYSRQYADEDSHKSKRSSHDVDKRSELPYRDTKPGYGKESSDPAYWDSKSSRKEGGSRHKDYDYDDGYDYDDRRGDRHDRSDRDRRDYDKYDRDRHDRDKNHSGAPYPDEDYRSSRKDDDYSRRHEPQLLAPAGKGDGRSRDRSRDVSRDGRGDPSGDRRRDDDGYRREPALLMAAPEPDRTRDRSRDRRKDDRDSYSKKDDRDSYSKKDDRDSYSKKDDRESRSKRDDRESRSKKDDRDSYSKKDDRESRSKRDESSLLAPVGADRTRDRSRDRSKDRSRDDKRSDKDDRKSSRRDDIRRDKSPNPASRQSTLSVGGFAAPAGSLSAAPGSPLLESYHGTYQNCSPMPSPLLLASGAALGEPLIADALTPLQSDAEDEGRKHSRRARFHDAEDIASTLAKALRGDRAPDVRPLIEILPSLTHDQMMELRSDYKKLVKTGADRKGVNIAKHIRARLKDEDPLLMKACYSTALGMWEGEAYWANFWYQGDKTRRELLIETLMGRTNEEIRLIKEAFTDKKYDNSLVKCMRTELKEDKFKTAVLAVLDERRMEDFDRKGRRLPIDYDLVDKDVHELRKAVKAEKGGESLMISIIIQRSDDHLRAILKAYEERYDGNFAREALKKSGNLVGEVLAHILNGVINRPVRDALLLNHALTATRKDTMRRELLVSRLVRFHWSAAHMQAVKRAYQARYGQDLQDAVREASDGDWGKFCRELCIARMPADVRHMESR